LAINKKHHAALLRMMPSDFFDGGGGLTPKEWLNFIDKNEPNGSWRDLQKSMTGGAKVSRTWSAKGMPVKVTRDNAYYFEFRKDRNGTLPVLSATNNSQLLSEFCSCALFSGCSRHGDLTKSLLSALSHAR
jgi:hypothetical protein